jgi:hypothetical protein
MVDYNVSPAAPVPANTWMSTTGGILSIIVGAMDLIGCLFMGFFTCAGAAFTGDYYFDSSFPAAFFGFIAFYLLIIGILSLVGGIFAVRRRSWGLALTGAIAALFGGSLLGILAIVFVAMSKKEFRS